MLNNKTHSYRNFSYICEGKDSDYFFNTKTIWTSNFGTSTKIHQKDDTS